MEQIKKFVEDFAPQFNAPQKVYDFFQGLGYKTLSPDYTGKESFDLSKDEREFVERIYTVCNYERRFVVFLVKLRELKTPIVRSMCERFSREYSYPFLVFTPDYQNYTFAFVKKEREDVGAFKRRLLNSTSTQQILTTLISWY
jgi:hypothetical protein